MLKTIKQWFTLMQGQPPSNSGETVSNQPEFVRSELADRELSDQELQAIAGAGVRQRLGDMF